LHTLRVRRHRLDTLFLTQLYLGSKFRPYLLEIVGLRVPAKYIRTLLCSMSAPHVKIVPLLDVHQLLMLSAGTLTYLVLNYF
jgi:hypothetical protein